MGAAKEKKYFAIEAVDIDRAVFALTDERGEIINKQNFGFSAGQMKLLARINDFFKKNKIMPDEISGIIAAAGPGSFTSIRIVLSVINAWTDIKSIPAAGFSRNDFTDFDELIKKGARRLAKLKRPKIISPFYGRKPDITKPKR